MIYGRTYAIKFLFRSGWTMSVFINALLGAQVPRSIASGKEFIVCLFPHLTMSQLCGVQTFEALNVERNNSRDDGGGESSGQCENYPNGHVAFLP